MVRGDQREGLKRKLSVCGGSGSVKEGAGEWSGRVKLKKKKKKKKKRRRSLLTVPPCILERCLNVMNN